MTTLRRLRDFSLRVRKRRHRVMLYSCFNVKPETRNKTSRYRVVGIIVFIEWVASCYPFRREPRAFQRAVFIECVKSVLGTRRSEPTRVWSIRRYSAAIEFYAGNQYFSNHFTFLSMPHAGVTVSISQVCRAFSRVIKNLFQAFCTKLQFPSS